MVHATYDLPKTQNYNILNLFLDVPQVYTPEELIGAEIGRPVHIKCRASAYPEALVYWRHGSK